MERFTVADARETCLPEIEEIEALCFSLPWTQDMLRSQLDPEGHVFLTAEAEGRVIGYVGLMYVLDEGYISNVAVHPSHRRQGVADALLTELERRAAALALSFLTLEVRENNAPAIALYEKHGFRSVGKRKNYYEKPTEDAILMTLRLNETWMN